MARNLSESELKTLVAAIKSGEAKRIGEGEVCKGSQYVGFECEGRFFAAIDAGLAGSWWVSAEEVESRDRLADYVELA